MSNEVSYTFTFDPSDPGEVARYSNMLQMFAEIEDYLSGEIIVMDAIQVTAITPRAQAILELLNQAPQEEEIDPALRAIRVSGDRLLRALSGSESISTRHPWAVWPVMPRGQVVG